MYLGTTCVDAVCDVLIQLETRTMDALGITSLLALQRSLSTERWMSIQASDWLSSNEI